MTTHLAIIGLVAGMTACAGHAGRAVHTAVSAPVRVDLTPTGGQIHAATDTDAMFALGWLHGTQAEASLRVQRCAVRACDDTSTVVDWITAAEGHLLRSGPEERRLLAAYAAGVNEAVPDLGWEPADSVALIAVTGLRQSPGLATELAALAGRALDVLDLDDVIRDEGLPTESAWNDLRTELPATPELPDVWTTPPPAASGVVTSRGDGPLLGVMTGRRPSAPRMVTVRLVSPSFDVTGLTEPGIPAFFSGHNGRVAWGLVPAHADVVDLVAVGIAGRRYRFGGQDRVLTDTGETVIGSVVAQNDSLALVLRTALTAADDETLTVLWDLARSDGAVAAVRAFDRPVVSSWHLLVADAEGHIADAVVGRIVRRRSVTGRVPHDGREGDPWQGRVDRLPRTLDPAMGVLATTGARPTSPVSVAMGTDFPDARRADRLAAAVGWQAEPDVPTLWTALIDRSVAVGNLATVLAGVRPATPEGVACRERLSVWDGDVRDIEAASIWVAWRRALAAQGLDAWVEPAADAWWAMNDVDPEPPGAPWRARPAPSRAAALDAACAAPGPHDARAGGVLWRDDDVAGALVVDVRANAVWTWHPDDGPVLVADERVSRTVQLVPRPR